MRQRKCKIRFFFRQKYLIIGQRYPTGTSTAVSHRGISRHSSFLVTSPPKMVAFSGAGSGSNPASENRTGQLVSEMMQQYETPINRRSSMALMEAATGGHRSLFHLSMPDIAANEKQQQPAALHKLASSCSGSRITRSGGGQKQPQNQQQPSNTVVCNSADLTII